ncbi:branched-chain amino acid ABC transporter permease [Noviherbaspirillum sp. UKPF54]|uniref:branched-chain amino acid ABC transporter permease n=1 Tax=Noviherbaspirillum sp. UKPF54 TaxID=2601898 RepID=UPI0011B10D09|nr:branched-chain amino acid ABC transporter permease [Noviherbaspirillum sp. UKPF54]QDZ26695.1 branched-chain amino acid ABC transporter permease [Noviherbaspirillum sp. UKPF54]
MKKFIWVALAILYLVVPALLKGNSYILSMTVSSLIVAGIAVAWALLGNLGGMVSFGHAAFFGIGAYASALLTMKAGMPVLLAIPAGGLFATLASLAMLPALRLSGPYFALAILAYAHIFRILATELTDLTGGSGGLSSIPGLPSVATVDFLVGLGPYLLALTIVLAFCLVYARVRRSDYGIALRAMHESEDATRVVGVNSVLLKSWMLLLSAFMAGTIGAFNAHIINFLEPDYAFSPAWSVLPIVAAIFGGYRSVLGPMIGAVAIYLVDQLVFKAVLSSGHQIVLGVVLAAMILLAPDGLLSLFRKRNAGGQHA